MTRKALSPNRTVFGLAAAVRARLESLRPFRAQRGAQLEGPDVSVRIVPWFRDPAFPDFCDLEVTLPRFGLPDDAPEELVAGAREAYEEGLNHIDEGVREAAALALEELNAPPVGAADLDGLALELVVDGESRSFARHENGRVLFRTVPARSKCQLRWDAVNGTGRWAAAGAPPTGEETIRGAATGEETTVHDTVLAGEETRIDSPPPAPKTGRAAPASGRPTPANKDTHTPKKPLAPDLFSEPEA